MYISYLHGVLNHEMIGFSSERRGVRLKEEGGGERRREKKKKRQVDDRRAHSSVTSWAGPTSAFRPRPSPSRPRRG